MLIKDMLFAYYQTQCLYIVSELRIADYLENASCTVPELASKLNVDENKLYRIMRFVSSLGLFDEVADKTFQINEESKYFDNASNDVVNLFLNQLELRSSPEEISFILKDELGIVMSHSTIYNHIKLDRLNGGKLYKHLRRRGIKYKSMVDKITFAIGNKQSIEQRAPIIQLKQEAGHWEIDTVFGKKQALINCITCGVQTQMLGVLR